jgi:hypothetical protein
MEAAVSAAPRAKMSVKSTGGWVCAMMAEMDAAEERRLGGDGVGLGGDGLAIHVKQAEVIAEEQLRDYAARFRFCLVSPSWTSEEREGAIMHILYPKRTIPCPIFLSDDECDQVHADVLRPVDALPGSILSSVQVNLV